ncbi:MAG: phytoene/squalene synthase family protein [Acidobacteria bacterium]|nr:phytoene/squalene synthase family protein [Acidobacteriota bacterium]
MPLSVEQSYAWCRGVARSRAKNFYYSFVLLSPAQRGAMCAVYAFMRQCDDLSDDPANPDPAALRASLGAWRRDLDRALAGDFGPHACWPALHDAVRRFGIPPEYLRVMIDGVSSDIEARRIGTFDELYRYCYQVASVVGLTVIHIFGFTSPEALPLAEKCGVAFQLTNILRDVREDLERDRLYLPAEDLRRFGVDESALREGRRTEGVVELLRFETARAREYYRESEALLGLIDSGSRASLWALREIYRRLLERIERSGFDVFHQRVRLPAWEKAAIVARAACGAIRPAPEAGERNFPR